MSTEQYYKNVSRKKRRQRVGGKGLTKKQKLQIEKMIVDPQEKKYYDTPFDAITISLVPAWYDISAMAQGGLSTERDGAEITLQNISYRMTFTLGDSTNWIRYLIIQWYPDNASDAPNWNQVMQFHTASLPTGLADAMGPYQLGEGTSTLFKVLVDEQMFLYSSAPRAMIKGFINKGFRKTITYKDADTTGANHIYLMLVSDSGSFPSPALYGYTRLRFTDS